MAHSVETFFIISRIELVDFATQGHEIRLTLSSPAGDRRYGFARLARQHGRTGADDSDWSALCATSDALLGQMVELDTAGAGQAIVELLSGIAGGQVFEAAFFDALGRSTPVPVRDPALLRQAQDIHVAKLVRDPAGMAGAQPVCVPRVQGIRCKAGAESRFLYDFDIQADLEDASGQRSVMLLHWPASSGWDRVESTVAALQGQVVEVMPGAAVSAALDLAMIASGRGLLPDRLRPRLFAAFHDALAALLAGQPHHPRLPYEDILPRMSLYCCRPAPQLPLWEGRAPNAYPDAAYIMPLGNSGAKGHLLEREALAWGLDTVRYNKGSFIAFDADRKTLGFRWTRSNISSGAALALGTHKEGTRACLARHGVPVPEGRMFVNGDFDTAIEFAAQIGYPVVCKPAMGVRGIGVVANIQTEDELRRAFEMYTSTKLGRDDFIIEEHIPGRDYRIVVVDDQVIAAVQREPGAVVGDGHSNIAELILFKNALRQKNPHLGPRPVEFNDNMRWQLEKAGYTLDTVLPEGTRAALTTSCNLSQGGDSIDVLDEMHPSIKAAAVAAVRAVPGMRYCGVDFLLEDHRLPIDGQPSGKRGGICELNAHGAVSNCEYPMYGTGRPVARSLLMACVETEGLKIRSERAQQLCLHVEIRGKVTRVGYRAWLQKWAERFGVTGKVRNIGTRRVEAILCGDLDPVTALVAKAVLGPPGAQPTSVRSTHLPDAMRIDAGFAIDATTAQGWLESDAHV